MQLGQPKNVVKVLQVFLQCMAAKQHHNIVDLHALYAHANKPGLLKLTLHTCSYNMLTSKVYGAALV